jgi:hypothetical protein
MLPDREQFNFRECIIAGDPCWLITPKELGVTWTDDNCRYRSAIVLQATGEIISSGFPKFVNFSEQPDFQPWNEKWQIQGTFKYDGSLIICSIYKGEFICRTRGTVNVLQLESGQEILDLVKYHKVEETLRDVFQYGVSFLFEYSSPSHVIVLREFEKPTLTLLGIIHHFDGYLVSRGELVDQAKKMGVSIPDFYTWNTIADCIADVKEWEGKEGIVLQSPDGQILKKIKSDQYRRLHSFMFGMKSVDNVLDIFMNIKTPKYSHFYRYIENTMDHEIAENCKHHILSITLAYSKVLDKLQTIREFIQNLPKNYSRKEQAQDIISQYDGWMVTAAFHMLDNKELSDKIISNATKQEINTAHQ